MVAKLIEDVESKMQKSLQVLQQELGKIRTGRAHPSLLEDVMVSCYGTEMPLVQAASINVLDALTLGITVWDKGLICEIEKAILNADLGLNPMVSGETIRVPLPPLTSERRKELIRIIRAEAEKNKVAIRNLRRDANHTCKLQLKEKQLTEDELYGIEEQIQKLTDKYIQKIDGLLKQKEQETMEV